MLFNPSFRLSNFSSYVFMIIYILSVVYLSWDFLSCLQIFLYSSISVLDRLASYLPAPFEVRCGCKTFFGYLNVSPSVGNFNKRLMMPHLPCPFLCVSTYPDKVSLGPWVSRMSRNLLLYCSESMSKKETLIDKITEILGFFVTAVPPIFLTVKTAK